MKTKTSNAQRARSAAGRIQVLALGMLSIVASFYIGVQTAGEVDTVSQTAALSQNRIGDINGDGITNTLDAIEILQLIQSNSKPTAEQLLGDPNEDGVLTIDDALQILQDSLYRL